MVVVGGLFVLLIQLVETKQARVNFRYPCSNDEDK